MGNQKLEEAAQAILEEHGYSIDIDISFSGDRRDIDPYYVNCRLAKNGQLIFKNEFRTELSARDDFCFDRTGEKVIETCLDIKTNPAYQQQVRQFNLKVAEFLKLKAEHRFTHRAEKKALKDECEELMEYTKDFVPLQRSGVYANIPLLEENEKELAEIAQKIKGAMKAQEAESGSDEMGA